MKQFLSACLAVLLLAVLLVLPAASEETADAPNLTPGFSVTAEAAYVANTDTGLVVYEKNSETPMAAASLTKLMTMILMLEATRTSWIPSALQRRAISMITCTAKMLPRRISGKTRLIPCAACCMPCCCPAPTRQRISWQTI